MIERDVRKLDGFTFDLAPFGYATIRIDAPSLHLATKPPDDSAYTYTGLITEPRAGHGEKDGQMYLLWGLNASPEWDHDDLYRSKAQDFTCGASTFVSSVTNEAPNGLAYRIMRHEDLGLDHHARYWYRIVPVFKNGRRGEPSVPFSGITRGDESP